MKQKIKIMKPKPELSDQEISRYMDFDGLLAKQKQYTSLPLRALVRWGILVVLIGGISFWWFSQEVVVKSAEPSTTVNEKVVEGKSLRDQPVVEEADAPQQPKDKAVNGTTKNDAINNEKSAASRQTQLEVTPETTIPLQHESVYLQAEPVEGYAHLYDYFSKELVYPRVAIKDSVQGVLTVAFTVNAEGKPENIQVTQSLGAAFDQEAVRLIQNMPAWKPAMLNNKPVPSKIALPLTFQIQKVKVQD